MRKMVIHFVPDTEGGGTSKHDLRDTDPAKRKQTAVPESEDEKSSWLRLLPREFADKLRKWERVIDTATMGIAVVRKFKKMPRRRKMLIGAVALAGVAGAAYLARKRK